MDTEKAFDSLDHFLISALEKYGFGKLYLMGKDFTERSGVVCY